MKMMKNFVPLYFVIAMGLGCSKFLDEKPDQRLVIPKSLMDCQALLDSYSSIRSDPSIGEVCADSYYLTDADWAGLAVDGYRRAYVWEKDGLFSERTTEWLTPYRNAYWANIVLETVGKIERTASNEAEWDNVKGQALFLRGRSFLSVAAVWAKEYDETSAEYDLGIPLRTGSNVNEPSKRSTLKDTYRMIIDDLAEASTLLPDIPVHTYRSSKPAALALQARAYLFMRDYSSCFEAANSCLALKDDLLDFNVLDGSLAYPIPDDNPEIIYLSLISSAPLNINRAKIDTALYQSYAEGDLRRALLFRNNNNGSFAFRGSYMGASTPFSGIAVNEVLLMRAECYARLGDVENALKDLNSLLMHRWNNEEGSSQFEPYRGQSADQVIGLILAERQKELIFRGIRWPDIKRLNAEGMGIDLVRKVSNTLYRLPSNDLRFTLQIPEDIISITGMKQNP